MISSMQARPLGHTLLLANPVSRSGMGKEGAERISQMLSSLPSSTCTLEAKLTTGPGDATKIAAAAGDFDTLLVLGGDGVIHEAVNGLMSLEKGQRPVLGVIPMGSGNDYARTLHIIKNRPEKAMEQLLAAHTQDLDVGQVNGVHFMETLSFGLDAAIALDTMNHRTTGRGAHLFADSGWRIFSTAKDGYAFQGTIDGAPVSGHEAVFAVQLGPTYGGGFRICPAAKPDDGLLDICYSKELPSVPITLAVFALARFGLHTRSKHLFFVQAHHIELDFEAAPPCQVDGERLVATHFEIDSVPRAIKVLVPAH